MKLFLADLWPSLTGLTKTFDPATYLGSNIDMRPAALVNRINPAPRDELISDVNKLEKGIHPPILPASLRDVEFGDERHFIREIAELRARRERGSCSFLFHTTRVPMIFRRSRSIGSLATSSTPPSSPAMRSCTPTMAPDPPCARVLTDWLVPYISQELSEAK